MPCVITVTKGDSFEILCTVKRDKIAQDITGWPILAVITDDSTLVYKATSNIQGGDDDQVLVTNGPSGEFSIYVKKSDTIDFRDRATMQCAQLLGGQKDTLFTQKFELVDPFLTVEEPGVP